jgi:peptidoglycan hydrolase-like protein with peptidoglycan-binding domain
MKTLLGALGALLVGVSFPALADQPVGAMHPEESIPANLPRMTSPGPYDEFTRQIQQKLNELGFDAGPVNGDFGWKTQAALAQFQIASLLPASGMPDAPTLLELDVLRPESSAAAGSTGPASSR